MMGKIDFPTSNSLFKAIRDGYRFWWSNGAKVRRAHLFCQYADGIRRQRARNWELRSQRLFRRAALSLQDVVPGDYDASGDWARTASRALKMAQAPYRRFAFGIGVIGGALALGTLLVLLVGFVMFPELRNHIFPRDLARGRPWVVSNAEPGYARRGIDPSSDRPFFFQTTASDSSWIEIDLGNLHVIRSVLIENRIDCCQERALPLNLEVFDGQTWQLVGQRRSPFFVWKYKVEPVRARLVRVRHAGFGTLHLKKISIYGQ